MTDLASFALDAANRAAAAAARAVADASGAVLCVSQFTLYGDVRRRKRPSFDEAARGTRPRTVRIFCGADPPLRPSLRNRSPPGRHESRTRQRRPRHDLAGFAKALLISSGQWTLSLFVIPSAARNPYNSPEIFAKSHSHQESSWVGAFVKTPLNYRTTARSTLHTRSRSARNAFCSNLRSRSPLAQDLLEK